MSDPLTIGSIVVTALLAGSEAMAKGVLAEGAKELYKTIKTKIAAWAGKDVFLLEEVPDSAKLKGTVAAAVDARSDEELGGVVVAAQALLDELKRLQSSGPGIIDAEDLESASLTLRELTVHEGTAIKVRRKLKTGDIVIEGAVLGTSGKK